MSSESLAIEDSILRNIPQGEQFISLFSGGKDSGLALAMASEVSHPIALIHCMEEKHSIHHAQSESFVKYQASSLDLPLSIHTKHWSKWPKLVKLFQYYKEQGAKFVVYGDLFREDNAQLQITLCKSAGLIPCMPLWKQPYEYVLDKMVEYRINSIISVIKSPLVDAKWLGKPFDKNVFQEFSKLDIDAFGEYGEYHTTLVDAANFKFPLEYRINKVDDKTLCFENSK